MKDFLKNLKSKLKKKAGFTLVELLVVVAIIGVLVAVAVPIFTGSTKEAQDAVDKANVRSAKALAAAKDMITNSGKGGTYYFDPESGTLVDSGDGDGVITVSISPETGASATPAPTPDS